jgi:UDP-N-acetylglucosamine acyltransferase
MIHATAVVHPGAKLHPTVQVGPGAVIDGNVELGAGCVVGPHAYLTGHTTIGENNRFHSGCVIGDAPQDLKYANEPTRLRIGDGNVFREHVTVHRSNKLAEDTVVGSNGLFMASCHIGHNCIIGNNVIVANCALLAGHVVVGDRAVISGTCVVHQFARVGTLAMMQGNSGVSKDVPPFCVAAGTNSICGMNVIGLRRAGISAADRMELKRLYRFLFREGRPFRAAIAEAQKHFEGEHAQVLIGFAAATKRGLCTDRGRNRSASGDEEE